MEIIGHKKSNKYVTKYFDGVSSGIYVVTHKKREGRIIRPSLIPSDDIVYENFKNDLLDGIRIVEFKTNGYHMGFYKKGMEFGQNKRAHGNHFFSL